MTFIEFRNAIQERMKSLLGEGYQVSLREVPKNNNILLTGLVVEKTGVNFAPSIYLEPYFKEHMEGRSFSEILREVYLVYESCNVEEADRSLDMGFFSDFEKAREKIAFKLVNYEKNSALLLNVPYIPYLDLAIVFYCRICTEEIGIGSILVTKEHMARWGIDLETLYFAAMENTPKLLRCEVKNLKEVIHELVDRRLSRGGGKRKSRENEELLGSWREEWSREVMDTLTPESALDNEKALFVLGNKDRLQGAASIMYRGVLQDVADCLDKDILVLPSSVHEVILMPDTGDFEIIELKKMVQEVNETQVAEQEVLSSHVYRFDRRRGELEIAV